MISRLRLGVAGVSLAALLALPLFPSDASAQASSRFRVMVTNLMPGEDTDDDFGKDLAKELRKLINELPTHQPVDEDDIKDGAKQFDMDMEDLNCIRSLQLATQIDAQLVMCGEYTENKQDKTFSLSGVQFAAPGGASFAIEDKTWGEKQHQEAAHEIFTAFETYVDQLRVAQFCGDYFNSSDYGNAEAQCSRAIEMNPNDAQVRYIYARTLMEMDRNEDAYEQAKRVVELDQLHEDGLLTVAYLATTMGNREEGRSYYDTYLQLNPGNAQVRMNIAYDMAQAGDPEGGMLLIEEGLANDAENTDMLIMHAGFASSAAAEAKRAAGNTEQMAPEVRALYEKALESYDAAYAVMGAEMEANHLRNMIAAHNELGQLDQAVTMAERALETHDDQAQLWSIYADVLKRAGRLDDAIAALDETTARDGEYQNVKAREASWRLEAGQIQESVAAAQMAVERGEQTADAMARMFFGNAYNQGINVKNFDHAIRLLELAKSEFEVSDGEAGQLDFWHGYALLQAGIERQGPQTLQTAQATLPLFQQANNLFQLGRVAGYADTQPSINIQQYRDASAQYMEIQQAIIDRGS